MTGELGSADLLADLHTIDHRFSGLARRPRFVLTRHAAPTGTVCLCVSVCRCSYTVYTLSLHCLVNIKRVGTMFGGIYQGAGPKARLFEQSPRASSRPRCCVLSSGRIARRILGGDLHMLHRTPIMSVEPPASAVALHFAVATMCEKVVEGEAKTETGAPLRGAASRRDATRAADASRGTAAPSRSGAATG